MRIASVGHAVFAATMIALGIMGLIKGGLDPIWLGVPKALPGREALGYLCAFVSLACGIGLFSRRAAPTAARVLFVYLLLWMLVFKLRFIVLAPTVEVNYQTNGENAMMVACRLVLYAWFAADGAKRTLRFAVRY